MAFPSSLSWPPTLSLSRSFFTCLSLQKIRYGWQVSPAFFTVCVSEQPTSATKACLLRVKLSTKCPFTPASQTNGLFLPCIFLLPERALRVRPVQASSRPCLRRVPTCHRLLRHLQRGFAAQAADPAAQGARFSEDLTRACGCGCTFSLIPTQVQKNLPVNSFLYSRWRRQDVKPTGAA